MSVGVAASKAIVPVAGASAAAATMGNGDLSWLVTPHHAIALIIGLLVGLAYRLGVDIHTKPVGGWAKYTWSSLLMLFANFWISYEATESFANADKPMWGLIIAISFGISVSGDAFATKLKSEFEDRWIGKKSGPRK